MKIPALNLLKQISAYKVFLFYGYDRTPVDFLIHRLLDRKYPLTHPGTQKPYKLHLVQGPELSQQSEELLGQLQTLDMFAPKLPTVIRISQAQDKNLATIKTFASKEDVCLIIEALDLPMSSKLLQWAINDASCAAIALYEGSYAIPSEVVPFGLTPTQQQQAIDICQANQEPLHHLYAKLEAFIAPNTQIQPKQWEDFLAVYLTEIDDGDNFIQAYLARQDANTIGVLRMLFSTYMQTFKAATRGPKKPNSFSALDSTNLKAHLAVMKTFTELESLAMRHYGLKPTTGLMPLTRLHMLLNKKP